MVKYSKKTKRFIILVPHRDALKPLDGYRQRLFAAGFYGAFSFPLSAPLAEVSCPFDREELKGLARNIRGLAGNTGGKITGNSSYQIVKEGQLSFYGPPLSLTIDEGIFPGSAKDKLQYCPNPPLLCVALAGENQNGKTLNSMETHAISFRAAYVANLAIRQLAGTGFPLEFSFEWKVGPPVWLPKVKNV